VPRREITTWSFALARRSTEAFLLKHPQPSRRRSNATGSGLARVEPTGKALTPAQIGQADLKPPRRTRRNNRIVAHFIHPFEESPGAGGWLRAVTRNAPPLPTLVQFD